jgi:hypothetical protein
MGSIEKIDYRCFAGALTVKSCIQPLLSYTY